MGRLFLVEFDEAAKQDYFMCKQCNTHIALADKFIDIFTENERRGILFDQAVNLQVDEPVRHWKIEDDTVADIYCVKCGDKLGWKYVQFSGDEKPATNQNIFIEIRKLKKKEGEQIVDAETIYPESPN